MATLTMLPTRATYRQRFKEAAAPLVASDILSILTMGDERRTGMVNGIVEQIVACVHPHNPYYIPMQVKAATNLREAIYIAQQSFDRKYSDDTIRQNFSDVVSIMVDELATMAVAQKKARPAAKPREFNR